MRAFLDTSVLISVIDADEACHASSGQVWHRAVSDGWHLSTTNYVVLETAALVQHRLGMNATQVLFDDLLPVVDIHWVGAPLHHAGATALLTARRRRLSLVDCVSFAAMRQLGLNIALSLDQHYVEQGFKCLPELPSEAN